ncbi:beta-lactamase family protein [Pseudoalteromonas sp. C2R02]|uniref:serine hydrolase domain-containing protein n=1 Tax=Pseudoalteromonas sp. C2R02 TaxID=2841565 RepID=UPI001C0A3016|nr:serine hydrolase domain-containing protein [Pseudoalteromonas sp. C2R02]MBU2971659.1 beta-lactamase family protein [Pseudoalteromonas sp. C2R02]
MNLFNKSKKIQSVCLTLMVLMTSFISSASNVQQVNNVDTLEQKITSIREKYGVPALGVTIIEANKPAKVYASGIANKAHQEQVTGKHLFRFGSITKLLPGIAILQLQEQGKLVLTDNLKDIAPGIQFENPWHQTNPVKIMHLLEHTTGWDSHPAEQQILKDDALSLKSVLEIYPQSRVSRWVPGTRSAYSNTGPTVAARIVEVVSGMTFSDYVDTHIFKPLGMNNSAILKPDNWSSFGVTPHFNNGLEVGFEHIATRPASALTASMEDMAKFINLFLHPEQSQILTAKSVERMQRIESELGFANGLTTFQGFAHAKDSIKGQLFYGHNGGIPGAISAIRYNPKTQSGFAFALSKVSGAAFNEIKSVIADHLIEKSIIAKKTPQLLNPVFSKTSGIYTKINSTMSLSNITDYFTSAVKVNIFDKGLTFTWLLGGYQLAYHQQDNSAVLYSSKGLAQVTLANDPISGEVLLRHSDVYQKTAAWVFYSKAAALALSMILILTSVFYVFYSVLTCLVMQVRHKLKAALSLPRLLIFICTALILAAVLPILLVDESILFKNLVWIDPILLLTTTFYPVLVMLTVWLCCKQFKKLEKGFHRFYLSSIVMAHTLFAVYLMSYQLFAIQLSA